MANATSSRGDGARPRGREQISAALIEGTLEALETHGLDISIRQIAAGADLPHSVIGRYFGSKDELIRAAIDSTLAADQDVARTFQNGHQAAEAAFDATFERPERVRIMVQLLQSNVHPRDIRPDAPVLSALVKQVREEQPDHADPRVIAVAIGALSMGMVLTEDYLIEHCGLATVDRQEVRDQVRALLARLL